MLVSGVQESDSVKCIYVYCIYIYMFFFRFFSIIGYYKHAGFFLHFKCYHLWCFIVMILNYYLFYFISSSLYLLIPFLLPLSPLVTASMFSVSVSLFLFCHIQSFYFLWKHTVCVFLCMQFFIFNLRLSVHYQWIQVFTSPADFVILCIKV